MRTEFDAVVIGAGPAGSASASVLAGAGLRVLLIDRAEFPRDKLCGDCINPDCWSYFAMLGVSDDVSAAAQKISHIIIGSAAGRRVTLSVENPGGNPFVALKRKYLDDILLHGAVAAGAQFEDRTVLEKAAFGHAWVITLCNVGTGRRMHVTSRFIIGADGRNSRTASILSAMNGLRRERMLSEDGRIGIGWPARRPTGFGPDLKLFFFSGGYGGIAAISPDEVNIALSVSSVDAKMAYFDFNAFCKSVQHPFLNEVVEQSSVPAHLSATAPLSPRRNIVCHPAAFLIGDAHRTLEPFTGEGILFAMQDAFHCAQRISVLFGPASPAKIPSVRSSFRINRIFSPILLSEPLREFLLGAAEHWPGAARLAAATVVRPANP